MKKMGLKFVQIMGHVPLQRALITTKEKVFPEALSLAYIYAYISKGKLYINISIAR